jgi:hypothetical protein
MLDQVATRIHIWRNDPVLFVKEMFNAEPDVWQAEALQALVTNDRIAIRSGHGVGKSTFLAWSLIWFLTTRYPAKIPCTAPSANTMFDVLWAEVRMWIRKMPEALQSQYDIISDRISLMGGNMESFASARTARREQPDALQGFHSENIMFLIDEAAGVDDVIFQVAAGAGSTEGAKMVLTGNPTTTSGFFAKAFRHGSGFWTRTVSCLEAKQVSRKFIEDMKRDYGEDSDVYRVRVLGLPPNEDQDSLIAFDIVSSAINREVQVTRKNAIWGLDVARYGNDTSCLVKRFPRGVVEEPKVWSKLDTMQLAGRIKAEYDGTIEKERPESIYVDSIGIGAGVVDRLFELGLPVVGINVSENPALLSELVHRQRDELWWNAKVWLESRECVIPNNERLVNELVSIRKGFTSAGKIQVESKDQMKRRGLRSPDVADAFVLTFAFTNPMQAFMSKASTDWKTPISRTSDGTYV